MKRAMFCCLKWILNEVFVLISKVRSNSGVELKT